ncbi:MAG: oligosaccharide flippase family protein [Patescibacteria group bacterium]|jgi:O-antigen/teichoic acid export membrane protein
MIKLVERVFNLRKKKFIQDTAILQIASFFSTGLSIIGSIIYARVLGVEGYAIYALIFVFVSFSSTFTDVGTGQTSLTLLSEAYTKKDKKTSLDILTYYFKVNLLVSFVICAIVIILSPFLTAKLYGSPEIGQLARVIILAEVVKIFFGMFVVVLQVIRRITYLAIVENLNKVLSVIIPAVLVLIGYGLKGLTFGYLAVAIFFALFSYFAYSLLVRNDSVLPSWKEIYANFFKVKVGYYFKFGFLIAIDKNLGGLYGILPIFLLGIFSLKDVAFLKIAISYAGLPSIFLASSVSRLLAVQLPKSKSYGLSTLKRDYIRSSVGSLIITAFFSIFFMILSPLLIPLIYGKEYVSVVALTYPLLVGTIFINLGVGSGPLFRTLNLMRESILINLIFLSIGGGILYYFLKTYPINITVYLIACWLPLVNFTSFVYLFHRLEKKIEKEAID